MVGAKPIARGAIAGLLAFALVMESAGIACAHRVHQYTDPSLDAALVEDAASGKVIFARNDSAERHPASLTKMMTLYLLFDALRAGRLTMASEIPVSANAAAQPAVHLGLREGETIPVETAIKAIVVCSDNDVAVAVGEAVGGTEPQFATMMNAEAHTLGMTHTFYRNASGLPDELQVTTAGDLAVLARHLVYDFPEYFPYFRTPAMSWQGRDYNTHNMLIENYPGADGIKTGYIDASGYNLVTTVLRGNTRLIAVVMGGISRERRDEAMINLLDDAFAQENVAVR
jgi:D-alanyl-D-alanine carboxypeptidase